MVISQGLLTRRSFIAGSTLALGSLSLGSRALGAVSPLTGADVVRRIKEHLDMEWDQASYRDTLKAGDLALSVKGVAVCFMSTLNVLQRANAQGLNFVLSHEPTFWSDADLKEPVASDHLYQEKVHFVEENKMIVFRLHDHWHRMQPEPMTQGFEEALGWSAYGQGTRPRVYHIPPTTLGQLGMHMAKSLRTGSVRLVGDPAARVQTVCFGSHALRGNIDALQVADVTFVPEAREWDSIEYARDLSALMPNKGMIVLSHEAGEESGFSHFPGWLQPLLPEVPVRLVATTDRMWLA